MLIKCHECNNSVSDQAPTCPKCGAPISASKKSAIKAIGDAPTTTQSTSKRLKGWHAVFLLMFFAGMIMAILNAAADKQPSAIPSVLLIVGLVGYIATRIRIWWHHG